MKEHDKEGAMRNTSENKVLRYNSSFVGTVIFMFGFLKFFEPFHTWFHVQIAKSGLPPLSAPLGIAGEISIGLSLLVASSFRRRIGSLFTPIVALASAGLIVNMAVAIYVHLQTEVPADVLPLGITPVHPAGLRALGWAESLSTLSNQ
jgi:hypothetical protein